MSEQDEPISDEVIADLWPDPETRPKWARRCHAGALVYTNGAHWLDCPERSRR